MIRHAKKSGRAFSPLCPGPTDANVLFITLCSSYMRSIISKLGRFTHSMAAHRHTLDFPYSTACKRRMGEASTSNGKNDNQIRTLSIHAADSYRRCTHGFRLSAHILVFAAAYFNVRTRHSLLQLTFKFTLAVNMLSDSPCSAYVRSNIDVSTRTLAHLSLRVRVCVWERESATLPGACFANNIIRSRNSVSSIHRWHTQFILITTMCLPEFTHKHIVRRRRSVHLFGSATDVSVHQLSVLALPYYLHIFHKCTSSGKCMAIIHVRLSDRTI